MIKNRLDFQIAAFNKRPGKWNIHNCSICNYPCGYVFCPDHERVAYDSGCDCVREININECSWEKLAEHYNMQKNTDYIKEMNEFWGFDEK